MKHPNRSSAAMRTAALLAPASAWLLSAAASAMQAAETSAPPQPEKGLGLVSPVGGYALMAIAAAAIISVSLIPAKRGHQD